VVVDYGIVALGGDANQDGHTDITDLGASSSIPEPAMLAAVVIARLFAPWGSPQKSRSCPC
jgi:hypothetical protein